MNNTKRILVCPLDWGLGHATRSVVVIRALQAKGHEVEIASSGRALDFLKLEFPQLVAHELPAYDVTYSVRTGVFLPILFQTPRIAKVILEEYQQTGKLVSARSIDAVISDNRYGCYADRVPCSIITHQLSPKMPAGLELTGGTIRKAIRNYILRFNYCWIPDEEGHLLSGELSHSGQVPFCFVGLLSRMQPVHVQERAGILALISGPEPQRTLFEKMMIERLTASQADHVVVKGVPQGAASSDGRVHSHLATLALNQEMARAALIICRSGYSSIMDIAAVGGKAWFVPTPGQSEQLYLARQLEAKGIAGFQRQEDFDLSHAMNAIEKYRGFRPISPSAHLLSKEIDLLLS